MSKKSTLPATHFQSIHDGLQILIPGHAFEETGILDRLTVQVEGDSPLAFQIWRPTTKEGSYHLHWYVNSTDHSVMKRVGDVVLFEHPFGIPVREGDIVGFHIYPSTSPISIVFHQVQEESEVFYVEGISYPYCDMSVCNEGVKSVAVIEKDGKLTLYAKHKE